MAAPQSFASHDATNQSRTSGTHQWLSSSAVNVPRRMFAPGEVVHEAGTPAQYVYFIDRGEVRVHQPGPDGSTRLVEILGPGDWFGVAALAGSPTCEKRAVAITDTSIAEVPVHQFLSAMEQDPVSAVAFLRDVARQLNVARTTTGRFVFDDCERRILKTLVDFSRTAAASPVQGDVVSLRITHLQLAQAIGVARETVSLALTKLRRQNLVQTGRNRLVFNPVDLQAFASSRASQQQEQQEKTATETDA